MAELTQLAFPATWPAPANVHAWVTCRGGGVSTAPFASLNLGDHVGDDTAAVTENRVLLTQACQARGLVGELPWLQQVHGTRVWTDASPAIAKDYCADASVTSTRGQGLVVMTADCLPVFFCDAQGQQVAVAHAGWRGLCQGVLEATLACFGPSSTVMAYLGPAIGPASFEVDEPVKQAFLAAADPLDVVQTAAAFEPTLDKPRHYLANLYALATIRLHRAGVTQVFGGGFDTVGDEQRFFSFRRDGQTGRMASVIWLAA